MKKKLSMLISVLLAATMLAGMVSAGAAFVRVKTYEYGMFDDVDESGKWYGADNQHVIKDVYELGIMEGTDWALFDPEGQLTLAQAVTMAVRVRSMYYGETVDAGDYDTYWFEPFTEYALECGLIDGIVTDYYPDYDDDSYWNQPAYRYAMASIFAKSVPASELEAINDIRFIPDYADREASKPVLTLYNAGVLTGNDEFGTFCPYKVITRAEAAAIISRIVLPENREHVSFETPELPAFAEGYTDEEAIDLFIYTALEAEFGDSRDYLIRWEQPIYLHVDGYMTAEDEAQLAALMAELNAIPGFPGIFRVYDEYEANLFVTFTPASNFPNIIPSITADDLWGYASLRYYTDGEILGMTHLDIEEREQACAILIDNEESDQHSRTSIIAEELLQSLGLLNDNETYPESIYYQYSNETLWPAPIDWATVKLLYHPYMSGGMTESQARAAAEKIIAEYNEYRNA